VPAALSYAQPIVIQAPPVEVSAPAEVNVTLSEEDATPTPTVTPPPKPEPEEEKPKEDPVVREAIDLLDKARAVFAKGDYPRAEKLIEKGIQKLPGDATLHEFRALTQFAQKNYKDAAATIYAVLSAGPGWNWETLKSCYDDEKTYQDQLRALEKHSRANPKSADEHFLLAYHYLVLDAKDAAIKQLEQVVQLLPKDELAPALLKALKAPPPTDRPQPKP
jgi:tetratricopeptide (TPR) repeat protein